MRKLICSSSVLFALLLLFSACGSRTAMEAREGEASGSAASGAQSAGDSGVISGISSPETAPESDISGKANSSGITRGTETAGNSGETGSSVSEAPPLTFTLVIPEGYTLPRIGMVLEDKGICTVEEFIEAAQNEDFSGYPLVAGQTSNPERCFKLEGYLFPDTYDIYYENTPGQIIGRILEHTEQKISPDLRAEIDASGYTTDEILTMASIIEKEAFDKEHMPLISSVLHNRLDSKMRLQCDVTITYVEGAIKPFISGDKDRYNSFYNTYKCAGLPAGAICNPGLSAIKAALRPDDTDYFYFVTDSEKNYYFAATWEEHERNVAFALG